MVFFGYTAVVGSWRSFRDFGMGAIASLVSLFEKFRVLASREIRDYHRFSYVVFVQSGQSMYQKLRLFMKFLNPQKNLGYRIDYNEKKN